MRETDTSNQFIGPDTAFSGLLDRLEREGRNEDARRAAEPGASVRGDVIQAAPGEPLTPELVLVDPDLARRAREQLPETKVEIDTETVAETDPRPSDFALEGKAAAPVPVDGFVQRSPATRLIHHQRRSRRRRRSRSILAFLICGIASTVAIARVEPLKRFFWESREATVAPAAEQSTRSSPSQGARAAPKPHAGVTERAEPSRPSTKSKTRGATSHAAQPPRAFAWAAVPNATYYFVQFFRGGDEIFRAQPSAPRLVVPSRWKLNGRQYSLTPGGYRWSVRPGFGRRARTLYGPPVVRAKLVVQRGSGG